MVKAKLLIDARPVESHSGVQGNIFPGPHKHSRELPLVRKFLNFSFQNGAFWCILYFRVTAGPPNVAGFGVAYPLPYPTLSTALTVALLHAVASDALNNVNGSSIILSYR